MPRKTKAEQAANAVALVGDARNRAARTFITGLAIDLAVAVALVLVAATSTVEVDWRVIPATLARTVVQSGAAYVLRRFVDPSRIPTPLPPDPVPEPADG